MKIPEGLEVKVWKRCFNGEYKTFTGPFESNNLEANFPGFNDEISSMEIKKVEP